MSESTEGASPKSPRYVSGIRPTGHIHLGNYLGAVRQWKAIQTDGRCVFFVADLHGIHSTAEVFETLEILVKCGVYAPCLSVQSRFGAEHLKLCEELQYYATIGQLSRMTQYKDKAEKETATAALLTYPVLMAADIFHNEGTHVPVGNDQVQHIELARDIWDKLPHPAFPQPKAVIGDYPRIMSLTDGTCKMSKSDPDDSSRINVTDSADSIRAKVKAAKTSMAVSDDTPEAKNLRTIYRAVGGNREHERWSSFKSELTDLIIADLAA